MIHQVAQVYFPSIFPFVNSHNDLLDKTGYVFTNKLTICQFCHLMLRFAVKLYFVLFYTIPLFFSYLACKTLRWRRYCCSAADVGSMQQQARSSQWRGAIQGIVSTVFCNQSPIIEIVSTRCLIFMLKCTKFHFGWGIAPDTTVEAYSTPQTPQLGLRAYTCKGMEGKGRGMEGRKSLF